MAKKKLAPPSHSSHKELTPRQIVEELNKYIIGQDNAKKSVAIALRNRWRRQQVRESLREEIMPNNIILIGPTGVGKTEIARRLAKLANAPFLKVEASKYTEVGYVGRDVESMIRELTELGVSMVKQEKSAEVQDKAVINAEERILDILLPSKKRQEPNGEVEEPQSGTREKFRTELREGNLDQRVIELEVVADSMPMMQVLGPIGLDEMGMNLQDLFGNMMPKKHKKRKVTIAEAKVLLQQEEAQKLIDMDAAVKEAIHRVENSGIIFLDEIDKIAGQSSRGSGPDVSREGVQRDLLPIVEGSNVATKYGMVKTDHILFIASGAFHISKPSDLIPELQGRFPIRVELTSLSKDDFIRILKEPENALIVQYVSLLATEEVTLVFGDEAIEEIAELAYEVNSRMENIGARRLHTIMEKLLSDISFSAPDLKGQTIDITRDYVRETLQNIIKDEDLSRYIL